MSFFECETRKDLYDVHSWSFWRNMIVLFCVFSVLGHTVIEWPYCAFGAAFLDTLQWEDEVLSNPFKPFLVYGFAALVCCVFLEPLKEALVARASNRWFAMLAFYIIAVFLGMAGELIQGFLQNQPVDDVYPLWDVSDYPGNILGQAWIVNDILLGIAITFAVWHICPKCLMQLSKLSNVQANLNVFLIVTVFLILVVLTY